MVETSAQFNMLTAREFRRLIARMGGLWSGGMLGEQFGAKARNWPRAEGFPDEAWTAGKIRLYSGWEVWYWLRQTGREESAAEMKKVVDTMSRRKFDA